MILRRLLFFSIFIFFTCDAWSFCEVLNVIDCRKFGISKSSGGSQPSSSGGFSFNPSSIPTDKGIGLEVLSYYGDQDFAIVSGTGRVGAAISASSYEDSFFGNMSYESAAKYLERKKAGKKFVNNKYNLATAIKLYDNKKKKLKAFNFNLGVIGKFNDDTDHFNWGAGLSLNVSVLSFGVTRYKDDYQYLDDNYTPEIKFFERYTVDTYTVGVKLPHLIVDYTYLTNEFDYYGTLYVDKIYLLSGTLFYKKWMFTYGHRKETSYRPEYDYSEKDLDTEQDKYETFMGIQYNAHKYITIGLYSNYYLNRAYTVSPTAFF
jgi:hypothetical protein